MFEEHGGFRTDLGPIPGSEIRGEDIDYRTIIEVIVGGSGLLPRVTCTRFRLDLDQSPKGST
jgi:hypothetical protein